MVLGEENADPEEIGNDLIQNIDNIKVNILNTKSDINLKQSEIEKKNSILEEKQKQVYGQSQEIDEKLKLLDTRNRMLQLSIDRNVYKKKVIYSLLAVIIALVVGMALLYSFYNKNS